MGIATELLRASWTESGLRLRQRCDGLTDEEYLWPPVPGAWNVQPDPERPGRWTYEYDFAPPPPAPVTTISWRLVHLIGNNEIYWEYAFGPGRRTFPDLEVPHRAEQALAMWWASREPISRWLESATDDALTEPRPSHLGEPRTAGEVVRILLDEQTHHGAEIALLRDLWAAGGRRSADLRGARWVPALRRSTSRSAPRAATYGSFVSFSDPDGNGWVLQGGHDTSPGSGGGRNHLRLDRRPAQASRRAAAAHGQFEARTGQADPNWPDWYADSMIREQSGEGLPA